jgi:hypothetical protein
VFTKSCIPTLSLFTEHAERDSGRGRGNWKSRESGMCTCSPCVIALEREAENGIRRCADERRRRSDDHSHRDSGENYHNAHDDDRA